MKIRLGRIAYLPVMLAINLHAASATYNATDAAGILSERKYQSILLRSQDPQKYIIDQIQQAKQIHQRLGGNINVGDLVPPGRALQGSIWRRRNS